MSATSLVTTIETKNEIVTSSKTILRAPLCPRVSKVRARASRLARVNPATTVIRQKSSPIVRRSIASR